MSKKNNSKQRFAVNPDGTLTKSSPFDKVAQAVSATGGPNHFKIRLRDHHKSRHYVIVTAIDHTYYHGSYSAYCQISKRKSPVPMPCSKDELYLDGAFHFTKTQVNAIEKVEKEHGLTGKDTVIPVRKIKKALL